MGHKMWQAPDINTDLTSHHIEGYAHAAAGSEGNGYFDMPLITQITDNMYTGGCIHDVQLPDYIDVVISLYPWEQYKLSDSQTRLEFTLFDSSEVPAEKTLNEIVDVACNYLADGKTILIHCQAGLNRSGLISALVLMKQGMVASEAIALLREKRSPVVLCNKAFESYLLNLTTKD